jgi:hypothetical protein
MPKRPVGRGTCLGLIGTPCVVARGSPGTEPVGSGATRSQRGELLLRGKQDSAYWAEFELMILMFPVKFNVLNRQRSTDSHTDDIDANGV